MSAQYYSKHGTIARRPEDLYMGFTDMRNLLQALPEDKKEGVTADFDSIRATVQGFTIGVRVFERHPYDRISIKDDGAPFNFNVILHFDDAGEGKTDFSMEVDADLNLMMQMMLGKKIKEGMDKLVDELASR
ncbi:MAG: SRPBCC family protein [Bacteroidales bacterium]|nr:SRPBCC family protein [Bacteroidales bacterium]